MTTSTLNIALQNQTTSDTTVYAFVTGQAINNNNAVFLLESDGQTPYYPASPSSTGAALGANCAIQLGAPGSTTTVTIPQIAGGRVWFSIGTPLTFLLNPGPALVEPSVTNNTDPNINISWGFCEFTFNSSQLYANISYVDFVCLPIALTLTNTSGATQHVSGMPSDGLTTVCNGLTAQNNTDNAGWNQLIVNGSNGQPLRALSPNTGMVTNSNLLSTYWDSYVDQVWAKYSSTSDELSIDTQAQWGTVSAYVQNGNLTFSGSGSFSKPASRDIFSCSTGPFAVTDPEMGALTARLTAGFNRSTLLIDATEPDGLTPSEYYQNAITNHYARIVHAANVDGRGYAFPYDDVTPPGGADQSGFVNDPSPQLWTVTVGGANASASASATAQTNTAAATQQKTTSTPAAQAQPKPVQQQGNPQQKVLSRAKGFLGRAKSFFGGK